MQPSREPRRIRDAAYRTAETHPGASATRVLTRFAWAVLVPLLALAALLYGGLKLGPAVRADRGEGTRGTFRVISKICHNGCSLHGDFVSDDGSDTRSGVYFFGGVPRSVRAGDAVRAQDAGDPFGVYPLTGSHQLRWSVLYIVGGGAGVLWWVWRYPLRAPGRRSTARGHRP